MTSSCDNDLQCQLEWANFGQGKHQCSPIESRDFSILAYRSAISSRSCPSYDPRRRVCSILRHLYGSKAVPGGHGVDMATIALEHPIRGTLFR